MAEREKLESEMKRSWEKSLAIWNKENKGFRIRLQVMQRAFDRLLKVPEKVLVLG